MEALIRSNEGFSLCDTIPPVNILTEIHRSAGVNVKGRTIYRTAVRGVILRGRDLLMVHSANVGDYKFPGGGVAEGESHTQALCREVREECGASILHIGSEIGAVIEYNIPIEKDYDAFKMTSHYYRCDVEGEFGAQKLDDYEQELGFKPVWIDIDKAIQLNKALLHSEEIPEWLRREIFILEYIQQNLLLKPGT
jgi:8-oxo-dGTP pyrophosphatase MutT (NUDIX family)